MVPSFLRMTGVIAAARARTKYEEVETLQTEANLLNALQKVEQETASPYE